MALTCHGGGFQWGRFFTASPAATLRAISTKTNLTVHIVQGILFVQGHKLC